MSVKRRRDLLREGEMLSFRYRIFGKIGKGSFGEVYSAVDCTTMQELAVKIEAGKKTSRAVLQVEIDAVRVLQRSSKVVRFITDGEQPRKRRKYFIMERLGDSLSKLRKQRVGRRFPRKMAVNLGIQMIDILESMHKLGYIHRDIKPSNFCLGRDKETKNDVFVIDFSLARRFTYPNGKIRTPRRRVGFRGTSRYASINSHKGLDLYPRDDVWSGYYSILEFLYGSLPWVGLTDRKAIGVKKSMLHSTNFYRQLPVELKKIKEYLDSLSFREMPNYHFIRVQLQKLLPKGEEDRVIGSLDWDNWSETSGGDTVHSICDINSEVGEDMRRGRSNSLVGIVNGSIEDRRNSLPMRPNSLPIPQKVSNRDDKSMFGKRKSVDLGNSSSGRVYVRRRSSKVFDKQLFQKQMEVRIRKENEGLNSLKVKKKKKRGICMIL